jgi:hypothetical protein
VRLTPIAADREAGYNDVASILPFSTDGVTVLRYRSGAIILLALAVGIVVKYYNKQPNFPV